MAKKFYEWKLTLWSLDEWDIYLLYFLLHPVFFTSDKLVNDMHSSCKCYICDLQHMMLTYNVLMLNYTCQNWAGKPRARPCSSQSSVQLCIPAAPLDAATSGFSVCSALLFWLALSSAVGGVTCACVWLLIHKTFRSSTKFSWEIFFLRFWGRGGGAVSLQMNDGLDSISLVFITFGLKCSSPVDRVWGLQSSRYVPCLLGSMRCHEHILNSLSWHFPDN